MIGIFGSGTNPVAFAERNVKAAFVVLVVAQPVRMDIVRKVRAVEEFDENVVAYFRADDGAENSQPLGLRLRA